MSTLPFSLGFGVPPAPLPARNPSRLAAAYVNGAAAPRRMRHLDVVSDFGGAVGIRAAPARALDAEAFPSGGAGMVGSAGEFLRLLEVLRQNGHPLLPSALVQEMGGDQTAGLARANVPGFGFGLGFPVGPARAFSVVACTNTLCEGRSGRFVTDLRDAASGIGVAEPRA